MDEDVHERLGRAMTELMIAVNEGLVRPTPDECIACAQVCDHVGFRRLAAEWRRLAMQPQRAAHGEA